MNFSVGNLEITISFYFRDILKDGLKKHNLIY